MPPHDFSSDPASDVFDRIRLRIELVCLSTFHAPWGIAFLDGPSHLHVVRGGVVWARSLTGGDAVRATAGDLLLFPRGVGHVISDQAEGEARPLADFAGLYDPATLSMEIPGPGPASELVCCRFNFDGGLSGSLLRAMPPIIHVPSHGRASSQTEAAVGLLTHEIARLRPGSTVVVSRVIDVLFIEALRAWAGAHDRDLSWLAGVGDPRIGRVLMAMHADPARRWTAVDCARIAGLSRSAFAERFTRLVGDTPLAYLTRWRLSLAADLLATGAPTASEVARRVGYASDAAFNRAFKARFTQTPAAFRKRAA